MYSILDLFSGIGGFSLGLHSASDKFYTTAFCEIEEFCQAVLKKNFKNIPIFSDIKELNEKTLKAAGAVKPFIITGGYPCQPFSVAGKRKGKDDPRNLWSEMFRLIKELKPVWVLAENVEGHIKLGLDEVLYDLESENYTTQTFIIPATGVGANHQRKRLWIVGYSQHNGSLAAKEQRSINTTGNNNKKRKNKTSLRRNNETMENPNNNGHKKRFIKTCNETNAGKEISCNRSKNTNNFSRRSDGRRNNKFSRINGTVQRLRNGNEEELTRAARVRGLHEGTDNSQGTIQKDRNQEDNNRTLVQKRQGRVQSSEYQGLGTNQTSLNDNQIRQGDDNTTLNRMETRLEKSDVAHSNSFRYRGSKSKECNMREWEILQKEQKGDKMGSKIESCDRKVGDNWNIEPNVGRVVDGIQPFRVDRLKALGNSIVPQIAEIIGKAIISHEEQKEPKNQVNSIKS